MYGIVTEVERLGPTYVRIGLAGEGLAEFEPSEHTDSYVSAAFPPLDAPYSAPFELEDLRELDRELRPFRRRYTIRRWDPETRTIWFEFAVHDVTGSGGRWAAEAKPGDALVFTGPAGGYRPDPAAAWHLMAGDESALPAIGASLEVIPEGVPVAVRVLVDGPDDEIELTTPGEMDLTWIHRGENGDDPNLLADSVREIERPDGRVHAFVHGEAEETRAIRRVLLGEGTVALEDLSCSPYWKRGLTDEQWREIKAAWVAEVAREAA